MTPLLLTHSPLQRVPDWPERLARYLASMRPHRYVLGGNDCVSFAAGAVQATTGRHVLWALWRDAESAAQVLRQHGGLARAVATVLPELPSPALAQRADVVLVQASAQPAGHSSSRARVRRQWLAVADGAIWWAPSATGLTSGPMHQAVRAWGVGHG